MQKLNTSLQMEDEIQLHEKGWIIQRVGWVIFIVILIGAGLGLFGTGYLSYKEEILGTNSIAYERFGRFETQSELKLQPSNSNGVVVVAFSKNYLSQNFEIEKIVPEPKKQKSEKGNLIFEFESEGPTTITFYVMPKKIGSINSTLIMNNSAFQLHHFIYP